MTLGEDIPARWAEISLAAVRHNVGALKAAIGPTIKLLAVVKAGAYGHGAVAVGRAALEAGAEWLGVATVREGLELRDAGIDAPILNMGATQAGEAEAAIAAGLRLCVYDLPGVDTIARAAVNAGSARVHLKVDTGMARLGAAPGAELITVARGIADDPRIELEAVWTHFAESHDPARTEAQMQTFLDALDRLAGHGVTAQLRHAGNSAAALLNPDARLDLVRCGLPLYGYAPAPGVDLDLRPVMAWKARVVALHDVPAGAHVGYGHEYTTGRRTRVATVGVGYADGYRRSYASEGWVLLRGQRAKVIGQVSMDFITVDATDLEEVSVGDEVVIMGRQGQQLIGADELARAAGTIPWEVLATVGLRVQRVIVDG